MKIEKLTENKIRIILKDLDLQDKSLNPNQLLLNTANSQSLLLDILNKAKSECNFDTDGCKLLIEGFFNIDDSYVFTITKYKENSLNQKRYVSIKNTKINNSNKLIYSFSNFDDFCNLCNFLDENKHIILKNILKNSILYLYNDTYYLEIDELNTSNKLYKTFISYVSEFSNKLNCNRNFDAKLKEYGKIIIKKNALQTGIKYFK